MGEPPHLTIMNQVKKKMLRVCGLANSVIIYYSKNSYIFVLKLRFGKRVTDVSPIGDDDIMLTILDQTRKSTNDYS